MKKIMLFAGSNIRKTKGQTVTILILVLLAALLLNLWLILALDYKQNFVRLHDKLNAEHVTFVFSGGDDGLNRFLDKAFSEDERVTQACTSDVSIILGAFDYCGGTLSTFFVGLEKQAALEHAVGAYEIIEDSKETSGIYLPYLFFASGDYQTGDTITITSGGQTRAFPVIGFYNSAMTASQNCAMCALLFTEDIYQTLNDGFAAPAVLASVRLSDANDDASFASDVSDTIKAEFPSVKLETGSTYHIVFQARYVSEMICSGIIGVISIIVTAISLIVLASNLVNYIRENMKNLGVLKALGYTSRQLISALLLEFLGLSLLAAAAGVALSYAFFPFLNRMMTAQTGIPYKTAFLPAPFFLTLTVIAGTITLTVLLSARKIRKIEPIVALRQGVRTHSFKKNRIPLKNTQAPLSLALALKTALAGARQNVTVFLTMLALSLALVFSGLMYKNVIVDITPMVNLIIGEFTSTAIGVSSDKEESFLAAVKNDSRVEKVRLFAHPDAVSHIGGHLLAASVIDDCSKLNNQSICYEGRCPIYSNEVAIGGKYARERGIEIGQEISLSAGGTQATFLVCGLSQVSNNLGEDCMLTREGYERMTALSSIYYYVDLKEGVDIDAFNEEITQTLGGILDTQNYDALLISVSQVYWNVITSIAIAILILSVFIIAFVLYLLVRTLIGNKKHDYGILKALGYTTGQLILQTALSFLPVLLLSVTVGLIASALLINPLIALLLSGVGVVKCTFTLPIGLITAAGIALVLFAFAFTCLLSLKIRKIAPRALLVNE